MVQSPYSDNDIGSRKEYIVNCFQLHQRLMQELIPIKLRATKPQRTNLALWSQALAVSPNCHLSTLALGLPLPGRRENLIQRLRRSLKNERLSPQACYQPLVKHLFEHWHGREVCLVMDRTDVERRWSILTLGVAYRKRTLPLAWKILPFGGTSEIEQIALLEQVQPHLPSLKQVSVHFYGDCEFRAVALQRTCQRHHWHWHVGVKSDTLFRSVRGPWQPLRDLGLKRGQRCYLQNIYLTKKHDFGPINLIADWSSKQEYPRYWTLDLPATPQAWRRGRKRFWIEPTFRDWKSYGFDLERSKIDDSHRLNGLVLGMALTTIWMIHSGDWLTYHGHHRNLTPNTKTNYSLFRLGRDHLQRCLTMGWSVPVGFTVGHGRVPGTNFQVAS